MSRKRDGRERVLGPTWYPSKERWRILVITPGETGKTSRRSASWYSSQKEAEEVKQKLTRKLTNLNETTISEALILYRCHLQERGTGTKSYNETLRRLNVFFPDLDKPLALVRPEQAQEYYEVFRKRKRPDGEPISVDYHRCALINARSFFTWAKRAQLVQANPFAEVQGIGRRNSKKEQHTVNETRKLYWHCLERAKAGDEAGIGVLMALLMALRSRDVTQRIVRDVDADVTILRVDHGKTSKSNRPRRIPEVLQPLLAKLIKGRSQSEPLFATVFTADGHHTRQWLREAMIRFCKACEIPYACPHSLKGTSGNLLAATGELADKIADHLSHEKTDTTTRHYVSSSVLEQVAVEKVLKVIVGGKK